MRGHFDCEQVSYLKFCLTFQHEKIQDFKRKDYHQEQCSPIIEINFKHRCSVWDMYETLSPHQGQIRPITVERYTIHTEVKAVVERFVYYIRHGEKIRYLSIQLVEEKHK